MTPARVSRSADAVGRSAARKGRVHTEQPNGELADQRRRSLEQRAEARQVVFASGAACYTNMA